MGMISRIVSIAGLAAMVLCGCGCPDSNNNNAVREHGVCQPELEQKILAAVNLERKRRNLRLLASDRELHRIARRHSNYMLGSEKLTHHGPGGGRVEDRLDAQHIAWRLAGENVARNRGYGNAAAEAMRGWMASAPHRRNILSEAFRQTGVGVVYSRKTGYYYFTQVFVRKMAE